MLNMIMFHRDSCVTLSYFLKGDDTRTSASYESLVRVHDTRSRSETIELESCLIRRRPLQTHTCLFAAMAD